MMCHKQKFHSERHYGNCFNLGIRAMADVHVYNNLEHKSVSAMRRSDYAH